ncbi:MAG TPA: FKBP-type peptidyl-prolyl cis-trans isomerase [Steroidobacteraceae bacterium]|nr:FKBP-type peptidyl-prolyl cis-trans isomerase [Steroidobacteraceae bacterium]
MYPPALIAAAIAFASLSAAQTPAPAPSAPAPASPAEQKSQGSYSLGVSIGSQLRGSGLTADSVALDRVLQGLKDSLAGSAQTSPAHNEKVNALMESARSEAGVRNKATARKFLDENGKKKGIVTTKSGLQYRVVTPGKGDSPKPTDQVSVHYKGTLLDGTEFDSSYKRGEPATFPVNGVIKGWQEALVLMKPGAKWELYIPPELAYDLNSPPVIPPGSALKFDVELLSIGAAPTAK